MILLRITSQPRLDPVITELEVRRSLDGLNPHKGADPDRIFPKVLKALNSHIAPVPARMFNLFTPNWPGPWRWVPRNSNSSRKNPPHNKPKVIQTHQPHVCRLQNPWDDPQRKAAVSFIPILATDNKATWLPPPSIDRNKPSICWRNGYSMCWWRGHSWHCLPGFRQSIWLSKSSSPTH